MAKLTPHADGALNARVRAGDRDAIAGVVKTYQPQLRRAARGAGLDGHQAEDVVQDTLATFVERADRFEGRSHVRTWLFGILNNKVKEARRAIGRDRRHDGLDTLEHRPDRVTSSHPAVAGPERAGSSGDTRVAVGRCLDEAPPRPALALTLRVLQELPTPDICRVLGITPTNLAVMLHRVRARLRRCLGRPADPVNTGQNDTRSYPEL